MRRDLLSLANMQAEDDELVPEIHPVSELSFTISAEAFRALIASTSPVLPAKEIIPNTTFLQFEAKDGLLTVSATDGYRSVSVSTDTANISSDGVHLLPGKKISEISKIIPDSNIRVDVYHDAAIIRAGRAVWSVQTTSASKRLQDFPSDVGLTRHTIDVHEFKKALAGAKQAVASSSSRLALTQILVANSTLTGCDGSRIHRTKVESLPYGVKTTLPKEFAESLLTELKSFSGETFEFAYTNSTVFAFLGPLTLTGQRLSVPYPQVDQLLMEPLMLNTDTLTINLYEVAASLKRVRVNADPDMMAVRFSVREKSGKWSLWLQAQDKTGNFSQEEIQAVYVGSKARDFVINYKYFAEMLTNLPEDIELRLGESTKTKSSPVYVETDGFSASIQPMIVNF